MSLFVRIGNHVHNKAIFVAVCIVMVVILRPIIGFFDANKAVHANVMGLGADIYWDQDCANRTFWFDWGSIEPGANKTSAVYVRNEGDSAAYLSIATSNWTPSASLGYMSLNWNYSGQVLSVDQVAPLEITLTVYPTINGITVFSFDTIITTTNEG